MFVTNEMIELIRKSLPEHLSTTLQSELAKKEEAEKKVVELTAKVQELTEIISERNKVISRITAANSELTLELKGIKDLETLYKKNIVQFEMLEYKAKLATEYLDKNFEILKILCRNTSIKERTFGTIPIAVEGNAGGAGSYPTAGYVTPGSIDKTVERTQE
jgi:hypothetical protein